MKLANNHSEIQSSGIQSKTDFSIAMNAKAFGVLSDALYENKIGSLVREISCNGVDSHIAAGTPERPIIIHVPDSLEPYFSVQDFGVGLSPDDVTDVFTVMFKSTKDDSNDMTGAFGLGSKTPFAYDDRFNITSIYNGVRTEYSAFKDSSGTPSIAKMAEIDTDEENGVTIQVAVREGDHYQFRREIAEQLKYFKVLPKLENGDNLEIEALEKTALQFDGIELLNGGGLTLVQGGVGYPIRYNHLREVMKESETDTLYFLQQHGCRLMFNIGEISVTASREGVEYNEHTLASIRKKITSFKKDAKKHLKTVIKAAKNDWDLACLLNSNPTLYKLMKQVDYKLDNTTLVRRGHSYELNFDSVFNVEREIETKDDAGVITKTTVEDKMFKLYRYVSHDNNESAPRIDSNANSTSIQPNDDIKEIYVRDTSNKPLSRVKKHMYDNNLDELYVIMVTPDNKNKPVDAFDTTDIKAIRKVLCKKVPVKRVSNLAAPTTDRATFKSPVTACYLYENDSYFNPSQWKKVTDNSQIKPSVFVTVDRLSVTGTNGTDDDVRTYHRLQAAGLADDLQLYAFNVKNTEKLSDDWVSLADFLKQKVKMIDDYLDVLETHGTAYQLSQLFTNTSLNWRVEELLKTNHFINSTSGDIQWIARTVRANIYLTKKYEVAKAKGAYETAYQLKNIFKPNERIFDTEKVEEMQKLTNTVLDEYALLSSIDSYGLGNTQKEHIIRYVNCLSEKA